MSKMTRFFCGTVFAVVLLFGVGALSPQVAQAASLTSAQVSAIIGLLQSFGADQSVINNVQVALGRTSTGGGTPQPFSARFQNGDRVEVATSVLVIRNASAISGAIVGKVSAGMKGTIRCDVPSPSGSSCPTIVNGYTWWYIDWDNSILPSGWSTEGTSEASFLVKSGGATMQPSTTQTIKLLVLLTKFQNTATEPYSVSYMQGQVFTNSNSVKQFYEKVSYNRMSVTGDVLGWYTLPDATDGTCKTEKWMNDAELVAQQNGVNIGQYTHVLIAFPGGDSGNSGCQFSGEAFPFHIPPRAYVFTQQADVIIHELGHTLGLGHANGLDCGNEIIKANYNSTCAIRDYLDPFDFMGLGESAGQHTFSFNAPNRIGMGWLLPANVQSITANGTYVVHALETPSTVVQVLKIKKPDSETAYPRTQNDYYYIDYNPGVEYDVGKSVDGVTIRIGNQDKGLGTLMLDMTPKSCLPSPTSGGCRLRSDWNDGMLKDGMTFVDNNGIRITQVSHTNTDATVTVEFFQSGVLTVLSPNGGEQWATGSTQTVRWNTQNLGTSNVRINLQKNDAYLRNLFDSTPNDGIETWTVPSDLEPAGDYKIIIRKYDDLNSAYDKSDAPFSVTAPSSSPDLVISTPPSLNSGTLVAGNTLTFKATVKNQGNANAIGTFNNRFRIDINNNGVIEASDPDIPALNSISNLGAGASQQVVSPSWTAVAGTYRLYACADRPTSPGVIAESDEENNCAWGDTITVAPAGTPAITVISPNGGEQWQKGTMQNIRWTAPSSVSAVSISLERWYACLHTTPSCEIAVRPYTLTASTQNDGVFEWTIGKDASGGDIPAGQYTVTVSGGAFSDSSDNPFSIVSPKTGALSINPTSAGIKVGGTTEFQAWFDNCPAGAQCFVGPRPVQATWTSSNPKIAFVEYKNTCSAGVYCFAGPDYLTAVVSGVSLGSATITATYKDSSGAVFTSNAPVSTVMQ